MKNLDYIWDNAYCIIEGEIVKIEDGLGIGSRMIPILAEILMKRWEKEKVEDEGRIRNLKRYVDDSIGICKGKREELEEKVKTMEDGKKGIKLKFEVEEKGRIAFLDVELRRGRTNERIRTKWFQ